MIRIAGHPEMARQALERPSRPVEVVPDRTRSFDLHDNSAFLRSSQLLIFCQFLDVFWLQQVKGEPGVIH